MTALHHFRIAALLEGWSYLILLFIAMPLKYAAGMPLAVRIVGSVHGFLFITFIIALYRVVVARKWPLRRALRGFLYSLTPFGAFIFDRSLVREIAGAEGKQPFGGMKMRKNLTLLTIAVSVAITAPASAPVAAQGQSMSFFVSSTGSGMGGNLGGLAGADKHCQTLAAKAGAGTRTWRAYLSTSMPDVNARDRIGSGPWYNAKGTQIAANVAELHSDKANINNDTALDEQGRPINPQGAPNRHDILTGSTVEGTATTMTCQNWTSSAADQSAMTGHHDRLTFGKPGSPWNSAHPSKGCSQDNLISTGGAGLIYCFAAK